jgi:uncharacterized protein (DUF2141 family)
MKNSILFAICFLTLFTLKSQNVSLTVSVSNILSDKGVIRLYLFDNAEAFPQKMNLAVKTVSAKAIKGTQQIQIDGIVPGNYAIAIIHDENNDGKLNLNLIGIPKEPTGASNGAVGKMGPPKYKDAVILISAATKTIAIKML